MAWVHKQLDILFVNTNSSNENYQALADKYAAKEPPTWSLLLAGACYAANFDAYILDADAERLNDEETLERIRLHNPRVVCFVQYGQNPNSGTTGMVGMVRVGQKLRETYPQYKILSIGSHTSALPHEVLEYKFVDYVCINEGVLATLKLLKMDLETASSVDFAKINGLGYKDNFGFPVINSGADSIVKTEDMDRIMPGYPWYMLPYKKEPLDLYRAHFWHAQFDHNQETPFATIYTSLGCIKKCSFCMINLINREDETVGVNSAQSNKMRFWSTDWTLRQFDNLFKMGVKTIRIADELFFFNRRYYEPILDGIIERGGRDVLNTWGYTRLDTVREQYLPKFHQAGVNYLAPGIEAASQTIRHEIDKGSFKDVNIREVVSLIRSYDINVIANYMFGFPNEGYDELQKTLDLAVELNTEMANMYCNTLLPGSPLYWEAKEKGWEFPETFDGYGFLSYNHVPSRTNFLTSAEVLKFRDDAWHKYFERPEYLNLVETKFGKEQRTNVENLCKVRLKRKLLGD